MMSKLFDMKLKTSLPDLRLENIDTKNPGWFVRNERTTNNDQLILVDPVDDEEIRVHRLLISN